MSVTHSTIDLTTVSSTSFEDAINEGVSRATSTLRNVQGVWIKDMNVLIENGSITGYKVNMQVTFVLDEGQSDSDAPNERHEREAHRQPTSRYSKYDSLGEALPPHVLLEDLSEDEIETADRFLVITPAKSGSGRKDVSINHDRYLAGD